MNAKNARALVKEFSREFFPDTSISQGHNDLVNVREATGLQRCCACCGDDIQSGMIYCGDLADLIADVAGMEGVVVAYCNRHQGRLRGHKILDGSYL